MSSTVDDQKKQRTCVSFFMTPQTDVRRNKSSLQLPYLRNLEELCPNYDPTLTIIVQASGRQRLVTSEINVCMKCRDVTSFSRVLFYDFNQFILSA